MRGRHGVVPESIGEQCPWRPAKMGAAVVWRPTSHPISLPDRACATDHDWISISNRYWDIQIDSSKHLGTGYLYLRR